MDMLNESAGAFSNFCRDVDAQVATLAELVSDESAAMQQLREQLPERPSEVQDVSEQFSTASSPGAPQGQLPPPAETTAVDALQPMAASSAGLGFSINANRATRMQVWQQQEHLRLQQELQLSKTHAEQRERLHQEQLDSQATDFVQHQDLICKRIESSCQNLTNMVLKLKPRLTAMTSMSAQMRTQTTEILERDGFSTARNLYESELQEWARDTKEAVAAFERVQKFWADVKENCFTKNYISA